MKKTNDKSCILLDNIKLIHEYEALKLVQKLTQLISESKDFNSALDIIMETFCETTGWTYAEAWIPEYNANQLRCNNFWFNQDIKLEEYKNISQNILIKKKEGLPGRIWESKSPEWISDITLEKENLFIRQKDAEKAGLKAAFGIPIISDKKVQIILVFFVKESYQEDQNIISLISTVATQLGWVIKHKELEERFKNSFEYTLSGRALIDINGRFIEVNTSLCNMLNYSEKQLLNKSILELLSEELLAEFRLNLESLLTKKIPFYNKQIKLYSKDGEIIWTQLEITIVFNSINLPVYFIAQILDITKNKLAEIENESLTCELHSEQTKVTALKSLLPMCAWCKKIRENNGKWEDLETYLSHHSNVDISHGICEDCSKKMPKFKIIS